MSEDIRVSNDLTLTHPFLSVNVWRLHSKLGDKYVALMPDELSSLRDALSSLIVDDLPTEGTDIHKFDMIPDRNLGDVLVEIETDANDNDASFIVRSSYGFPDYVVIEGMDTAGATFKLDLEPCMRDSLACALSGHRIDAMEDAAGPLVEPAGTDDLILEDDEPDLLDGVVLNLITIKGAAGTTDLDVAVACDGDSVVLEQSGEAVYLSMEQAEKLIPILTMMVNQ